MSIKIKPGTPCISVSKCSKAIDKKMSTIHMPTEVIKWPNQTLSNNSTAYASILHAHELKREPYGASTL